MEHVAPLEHFRSGIRRAVELMGSQRALAEACSVKQGTIWAALNNKAKMPAWLSVRIVEATSGRVSMRELLPEVYEIVEREVYDHLGLV